MTCTDANHIPPAAGTYALILHNPIARPIEVGRIGRLPAEPGYYTYVGSALGPGGLRARVLRHFSGEGKRHWHIDYLRQYANIVGAWLAPDAVRHEHQWVDAMSQWSDLEPAMPGFGSSDCNCSTHLFFSVEQPSFGAFQAQLEWCGYPATGLVSTTTADHSDCATVHAHSPRVPGNRRSPSGSAGLR